MRIVVISPESEDPREAAAMGGMFAAGLDHYHIRKPAWGGAQIEAWLGRLPAPWLRKLILHGHPEIAARLGLGGHHDQDRTGNPSQAGFSRSCHDLASLRRHLPAYRAILFGPVFPSISKPGYGPPVDFPWEELKALLRRKKLESGARVLAIGGVTAARLARCRGLGFDGAAVMGAVWGAPDPSVAYIRLRDAAARLEAARNAA
jgi:thiamine-phosphate pyrophosphorylase